MNTEKKEIIVYCPLLSCKQILVKKAVIDFSSDRPAIASFHMLCPHCKNLVKVDFGVAATATILYRK